MLYLRASRFETYYKRKQSIECRYALSNTNMTCTIPDSLRQTSASLLVTVGKKKKSDECIGS
ncbi:hypothetical protein UJ203_01075 [Bacillus sp. V26]|uniref:hypothetical protein n=1 Tax=Bacillus sp. V26 TaxID=3098288 RepID=UPI002AACE24E|nr:hypothetical protein [Bacillus sp. V26]MDY7430348.1 hypothetical protein [Bacillus sp. V26]